MRIALCHNPPPGGAERSMQQLALRLAGRHTVHEYRLGPAPAPLAPSPAGLPAETVSFAPFERRRRAPLWNAWQELRELGRLEAAWRDVAAMIDRRGYDVALVSVCQRSAAPAVLGCLTAPTAYFCHEPPRRFSEPWCRPDAGPLTPYERARARWQRPMQAVVERQIQQGDRRHVRLATRVLTNSAYTARRIDAVYGRDAQVSYLGVDPARFHRCAPAGRRRALSVGSLEAHKGFDFLIRALGRVPAPLRPALTIVGGSGHPRMPDSLQQLAARLDVELDVHTRCSDGELAALYAASSLFLFAGRYEPFGLVVLEAMAAALPVVAVAEGGVRESVVDGQTGCLVPRDETAFAAAVARLLCDAAASSALGAAGRTAVLERWTWEHAAERMEARLASVGNRAGSRVRAGA